MGEEREATREEEGQNGDGPPPDGATLEVVLLLHVAGAEEALEARARWHRPGMPPQEVGDPAVIAMALGKAHGTILSTTPLKPPAGRIVVTRPAPGLKALHG